MKFIKDNWLVLGVTLLAVAYIVGNYIGGLVYHNPIGVNVIFDLSLAIIASFIFYAFQFLSNATRIRKIANQELEMQFARLLNIFQDIFISSLGTAEIDQWNFDNLKDFFSPRVSKFISTQFDLEAKANASPARIWATYLASSTQEFEKEMALIASKYSAHLTSEMLEGLYALSHNPLVAYMRILDNPEVLTFQKRHHGRTFLPSNFLEEFFRLILKVKNDLYLNIGFSSKFINAQRGLLGKAKLKSP